MTTVEGDEPPIDWSKTTWKGAEREAMRRWAELPLEDILVAQEEMASLADVFRESEKATDLTVSAWDALRYSQEPYVVGGTSMNHRDFRLLTGHEPLPWQEELYARFTGESQYGFPTTVCIPTGLGKTGVIAVWLMAWANGADVPRRLVYVVNRRTVVDQTTNEAVRLRENASRIGVDDLAISTLRGQFADNREWSADPCRPAVICGTVDMIGSRLLFNGYRIGFRARPLHSGLLGQDALVVHDEAHLEPAFQNLIERIQYEQHGCEKTGSVPWPKLRTIALSATTRADSDGPGSQMALQSADQRHPEVRRRITATKTLHLYSCSDEKNELAGKIVERALANNESGRTVLIFARRVGDARTIREQIDKQHPGQVVPLTGTMRGWERDNLVRGNPVFARFVPEPDRAAGMPCREGTVYLVCTSAGEVGVNLTADHMVCDLSTLDSMMQRLGRVNRFGKRNDSRVDVVWPERFDSKDRLASSRQATLELLKTLGDDASPQALTDLLGSLSDEQRENAFAPMPAIPQATDILFDAWAMTTIRGHMPGRPPVAPYLHGFAEWEPPRTSVAWRAEVEVITRDDGDDASASQLLDRYPPAELLDEFPLKPHELLTDTTERVYKMLSDLAKRSERDPLFWVICEQEDIAVERLESFLESETKQAKDRLAGCTVLLPPSIGGLSDGTLDGNSKEANDVADEWHDDDRQRRIRLWDDQEPPPDMALVRTIDTQPDADELTLPEINLNGYADLETEIDVPFRRQRIWYWYVRPADAENQTPASTRPVSWQEHTDAVVCRATEIVRALGLPDDLQKAVILAAELHDLGKRRELWQRTIGNPRPKEWYAKPGKPENGPRWRPRHISPYRHEFGSLLDVLDEKQAHRQRLDTMSGPMRDVVLHLIAAHHGYARPHFPQERVLDPNYPQASADETSLESMRRFARLQRRYGRWGLAYLESLLRAADWAASAERLLEAEGPREIPA